MRLKDIDEVWMDDNHVDFSRKHKTTRNNCKISKEYEKFNPADLEAEIGGDYFSPSINASTWEFSEEFDERLNDKSHLLNKCESDNVEEAFESDRAFDRFFDVVKCK